VANFGSLENVDACVFYAYETLFDFSAAAGRCRDDLVDQAEELNALWRSKQLQYTWLRSFMGKYVEFWKITGDALDYSLDSLGIQDAALRQKFMDLFLKLDTFPEIKGVLARLKDGVMKPAILSNSSLHILNSTVEGAELGDLLHAVISVNNLGVYRPHPTVCQLAVDSLDVSADRIFITSSNPWDASGAAAFEFRVVWWNRYGQKPERLPGKPMHSVITLTEIPAMLGL